MVDLLFLLQFFTMSALLSSSNCDANFLLKPSITRVVEGQNVTLKCKANILNGFEYYWVQNGVRIETNTRMSQINADLSIVKLNKTTDNGNYVCTASNNKTGDKHVSPADTLDIIWLHSTSVHLQPSKIKNAITLRCHIDGSATNNIKWFKNKEELLATDRLLIQKKKLVINRPSRKDNGIYKCSAKNKAGHVVSKKNFILEIEDNKNNSNNSAIDGNIDSHNSEGQESGYIKSRVRCAHRNSLRNKLSNRKKQIGGSSIKQRSKKNHKNKNRNNNIKKNHNHNNNNNNNNNEIYLCRGKRGDRLQEYSNDHLEHNNAAAADFKKVATTRITINESDPVLLDCDLKSNNKKHGAVNVKWIKDNKFYRLINISNLVTTPTSSNDSSIVREDPRLISNRKNGSLTILQVSPIDDGHYECEIYNADEVKIKSKQIHLSVITQLKFISVPTSKQLELGIMGKVHCKVQGTPLPHIKWFKEIDEELPDTVEDINGTLIFKNVTVDDKGNYTCTASNAQGTINATVNIITVIAPKFLVAPIGPILANESQSVIMHCQAFGDPKPTVQWDKDLNYLNNSISNRFQILENGSLLITDVQVDDEGKYGCTIGNSAGLKREEIKLLVKITVNDGIMITRAVIITVLVAVAYIILVVGLMLWCRHKRQARKARMNLVEKEIIENADEAGRNDMDKNGEIEPCLSSNDKKRSKKMNGISSKNNVGGGGDAQKSDDTAASGNSKISKKSSNFDQITISRNSLFELIQIGRGDFGDVFIGKIKISDVQNQQMDNPSIQVENETGKFNMTSSLNEINEIREDDKSSDSNYKQVLVKALNKIKDENICMEFRRQIDLFRTVSHQCVSKLYGLCRDKDPHYLVLEYTDWGDLKQFLLATIDTSDTNTVIGNGLVTKCEPEAGKKNNVKPPPLKMPQYLIIGQQIAKGMDAIYKARFIHKDLAIRNCIITSNFIVKVSYPALTKDKYANEYFKYKNVLLPLRWLAPECLIDDDYSTKSDVYSFAVSMWELFTCGQTIPLSDLTNDEFLLQLQQNKLNWKIPDNVPDELRKLLVSCWNVSPKDRPAFNQLASAFGKCMKNEKSLDI